MESVPVVVPLVVVVVVVDDDTGVVPEIGAGAAVVLLMALVNLTCMAFRTPCADLASGLRSHMAENRSMVQWNCRRALCFSSGCSRGKMM